MVRPAAGDCPSAPSPIQALIDDLVQITHGGSHLDGLCISCTGTRQLLMLLGIRVQKVDGANGLRTKRPRPV